MVTTSEKYFSKLQKAAFEIKKLISACQKLICLEQKQVCAEKNYSKNGKIIFLGNKKAE